MGRTDSSTCSISLCKKGFTIDFLRDGLFFGDFLFRSDDSEYIELEWTERGKPDTPWKAHVLSDGTLRFICLTTLLLQPEHLLPDTVLIDEPELGLHPFAINLLADMLQQVAETKQVIVSTQSVELLNAFRPENVVVVQREQEQTIFKRLDASALQDRKSTRLNSSH